MEAENHLTVKLKGEVLLIVSVEVSPSCEQLIRSTSIVNDLSLPILLLIYIILILLVIVTVFDLCFFLIG